MPQILDWGIDAHRIHELAGIHAVLRVPQRFELAKGLHELRAKHFGQQRGARLSVAVFAAEGSTETQHHIRGAIDEFAELSDSFR